MLSSPFNTSVSLVDLSRISLGLNRDLAVPLLLVKKVERPQDNFARSFLGVDQQGNTIGLTVYNIDPKILKLGDSLLIAHPYVTHLHEERVICADEPLSMAINGKRIDPKQFQFSLLKMDSN